MASDRVTEELRTHLIVMHAETAENLAAMIAELRDTDDERSPTFADATEEWLLDYIHTRQHESGDWNAGHDEADESTSIDWTPLPGHWPGQAGENQPYLHADHKGMHCELREAQHPRRPAEAWEWSFYDDASPDPDLAVARGDAATREDAERELREYIDGYIQEV